MTTPTTHAARIKAAHESLEHGRQEVASRQLRLMERIQAAKASGMTLQAIGDVLGLSRQRVKQLLDR